jgi:hypothetical protein
MKPLRTTLDRAIVLHGATFCCSFLLGLTNPALGQPSSLQLRVQPWTGYTIESSADLDQWTSGKRVFVTNSTLEIAVSNTAVLPMEYFRARETSNDHFTNRFAIEGFPATVYGSDVNATSEPGEPELGFGQTVWWTWMAPRTSRVGICFAGTDFHADLGVFTGDTLADLVRVPVTYGSPPGGLVFDASSGTTYQFQFGPIPAIWGGAEPSQGPLQFTLAPPPPNDDFFNRITLVGGDVLTNMPAFLATREPFETNGHGHSIWWSWTAPTDGSVSLFVDCQNYGFPPEIFAGRVNVFTGQSTNDLTPVPLIWTLGSNSTFHFDAVANTTYQIAQDSNSAGNYSLQLHLSSNRYLIKAYAWPWGMGNVSLDPVPDADGLYASGTVVTITAAPNEGYEFMGWTGTLTNASPSMQISMDHSYQLEATFGQ